jgi:hypothetical protein
VFSPGGQYFCILMKKIGKVIVYEVPDGDMEKLFNLIDDDSAKRLVELTDMFGYENIKWDADNKFITIHSKSKFSIIDMREESEHFTSVIENFQIDNLMFDQLITVEASTFEDDSLRCEIACLVKNQRNIRIFDPFN